MQNPSIRSPKADAPKLMLLSREDFGALTLHEKNAYLQDIAHKYAEYHNREVGELNRDTLRQLIRLAYDYRNA